MCEGATYGKVVPSRLSLLRSTGWRQSLKCFANSEKPELSAAGTVAPSHPLLKFGKLTTKFEMLYQFRKSESYRPSVAAYGKVVPSRFFSLTFGKLTTKFEMLSQFREAEIRRPFAGRAAHAHTHHRRTVKFSRLRRAYAHRPADTVCLCLHGQIPA